MKNDMIKTSNGEQPNTPMQKRKVLVLVLLAAVMVLVGSVALQSQADTVYQPTALFDTQLSQAMDNVSTSTMVLQNGLDKSGNLLNAFMCFTVDGGLSNVEYVCGSASGTIVSNLIRGIDFTDGVTSNAGRFKTHRIGADVKQTDYPYLSQFSRLLNGSGTFPNPLTYAAGVSSSSVGANGQNLASVNYANSLSFAGAPNASVSIKGISQIATTPQLANASGAGSTGAILVAPASSFNQSPSLVVLGSSSLVATSTGGSIASGTYYYVVTQTNNNGESTQNSIASTSVTGNTNKITVSWTGITSALYYSVYRSTTSTYTSPSFLATTTALSYVDSALSASAGAPPVSMTAPTSTVPVTNSSDTIADGFIGQTALDSYAFQGPISNSGVTSLTGTSTAPYLAPPGAIEMYASSTAPKGWLLADGTQYATTTYPNLFSLFGYTYGGSTSTFGMPNIGGRFVAGPSSTSPFSATIGTTGGATSTVSGPYSLVGATGVGGANPQVASGVTNSSTLSIVPPFIILQYIIKF